MKQNQRLREYYDEELDRNLSKKLRYTYKDWIAPKPKTKAKNWRAQTAVKKVEPLADTAKRRLSCLHTVK